MANFVKMPLREVNEMEIGASSMLTKAAREAEGGTLYMGRNTNEETGELKKIELAARTCYKSEDKITVSSSVSMFQNLEKRGHMAMLRFGERAVKMKRHEWLNIMRILTNTQQIQYWRWAWEPENPDVVYVTANLCSWLNFALLMNKGGFSNALRCFCVEAFEGWPVVQEVVARRVGKYYPLENYAGIEVWDAPIEELEELKVHHGYDLFRYCFRVVTDRGITHEIVRHTTLSYAQESTRWINYNRGNKSILELMFIPQHLRGHKSVNHLEQNNFIAAFANCYDSYQYWTAKDNPDALVPGDARNFLPHCLKTEICISGYLDKSPYGKEFNQGFSHFIDMRSAKDAHKGIQVIANEMAFILEYKPEEK